MSDLPKPIVRFAPSPTGRLHIGNLRTALFNWLFAKKQNGSFVLRLDDTDQERSTDEFAEGIATDLAWLGILPDMKAKQSDRVSSYDAAAEKLKSAGLLYPCYETPDEIERRRKRLMARGLPPVYERTGLKQTAEERAALEAEGRAAHWRFLLPNFADNPFEPQRTEVHWDDEMRGEQTVDLASMSDPVLIRGDGTYLYTLPSVVDDIDMGITHIIRGGDHVTNTGAQIALFEALGATPPAFGHHNLLTDASGEGLSKRKGALSLASLREDGIEPMALASLATLIGTGQAVEVCDSMSGLATLFDPTKVTKSPARFDSVELEGLNEKLLHAMSYSDAQPRLKAKGMDRGEKFWNAVRPNLTRFDEVSIWHKVLEGNFPPLDVDSDDVSFLETARETLPQEPWADDIWKTWTTELKEKTDRKGRSLFMPLRKALTGKEHGPDMGEFLPLIGREKSVRRLS